MERARVAVSSLSDNSLTRLPQLVELLRHCLLENTILCLSRLQAKLFAIVTICRSFGGDIFVANRTDSLAKYIVIVSDAADSESVASCLTIHSSFNVLRCSSSNTLASHKGNKNLPQFHVLLVSASTLRECLQHGILTYDNICLFVFNECHFGLVDEDSSAVLQEYKTLLHKGGKMPLIMAVTTVLSTMYIEDSQKLEGFLFDLGNFYSARINVDRTMLSLKYSQDSKLREQMIVCSQNVHEVRLSLEERIKAMLSPFKEMIKTLYPSVVVDCHVQPDVPGAAKISYDAIEAVLNVTTELGPFCSAKVAENFVDQFDQHYSCHISDIDARKMLKICSTLLRQICQLVDDYYASNVLCLDDVVPLVPKKIMAFLKEFKKWMPNIDFKITPAATLPFDENKKKKGQEDDSDDEDDDDEFDTTDFSDDMSSDSTDAGMGKGEFGSDMPGCTPVDPSTFRRHRRQANIRMMKQIIDGSALSALVVVKTPFEAYALAMLIDEICKYDSDLFFLKVGHYSSLALQKGSAKSLLLAPPARLFLKYQSNVLHRFRQRRLNVLVTTDLHGTSVTLPPINHVVRLGVPFTYESYIGSKSFCQTQNSVMTVVVDEKSALSTQTMLKVYRETENVLMSHCVTHAFPVPAFSEPVLTPLTSPSSERSRSASRTGGGGSGGKDNQLIAPFYPTGNPKDSAKVTADNAIMIINRYCAKLPSDVFTRLTCLLDMETVTEELLNSGYRASLTLPIISPLKTPIQGGVMPTPLLALKSAAAEACRMLHQQGELDDKLNPVTFEVWKCEDMRQDELQFDNALDTRSSSQKPATTNASVAKRKQSYAKRFADALTSGPALFEKKAAAIEQNGDDSSVATTASPPPPCRLYQIRMKRIEAPILTLVDRAYDSACCPRHYGFVTTDGMLPSLPTFPVFTRYCDLEVTFESLEDELVFSAEQLDLIRFFHRYVFHIILRIEKDVLFFQPEKSPVQAYLLPLTYGASSSKPIIDWDFIRSIKNFEPTVPGGLGTVYRRSGERFAYDRSLFEDAVVYRSYCGFVANDLYYVVNIRDDYSPKSQFPSDQYDDFVSYYEIKYRLMITNASQPLLDVDHTTAHLNMVLPRRCSGKLVPTTEEENAQRLWFIPELCGIHPFPASMWHKAACLPTIFYRLNALLVSNETLHMINAALGLPDLTYEGAVDGLIRKQKPLLEYSQLRAHQMAAFANQAADITHWLPSEPLLNSVIANDPKHGVCSDCLVALDSVVFRTLWLYFKRESYEEYEAVKGQAKLTCLICHNFCINECHAIAHLRHRHSWLYTQPWSFKADSTCPLCQAMTEALQFSYSQLQPCELPISAIECPCADNGHHGLCSRLSDKWSSLRPKISYLLQSKCRPPNMCDVLTALTASNANDMFSYERLETVGDSFLKFAVTAFLYLSCPGVEEGKLTYMRSRQVCNLNLYHRGRSRGLAERMFVSKFEPSEAWLPPGYVCLADAELDKALDQSAVWKGLEKERVVTNGHSVAANEEQETSVNNAKENEADDEKGVDRDVEKDKEKGKADELIQPQQSTSSLGGERAQASRRGRGRRGRGRGRGGRRVVQEQAVKAAKSDDSGDNADAGVKGASPSKSDQIRGSVTLHTHQSLSDKNIADCVEALLAAYLVTGGHDAALHIISWFGIKVLPMLHQLDSGKPLLECVGKLPEPVPPLLSGVDHDALMKVYYRNNLGTFESLIGYHFRDKAYIVQAFCHASFDLFTKVRLTDSYQRLELLGDAILDYLITRHMYELHSHYSPGVLTDLRSALVNNNIFSSLAVRWSFHRFLLYASPGLFNVVVDFVNLHKQHGADLDLEKLDELEENGEALECPKVLGDIFESVAGAIYLDSGLSLEAVWLVYYRMLKPVIDEYTANIPKSPVRELLEREPETARFLRPERTIDGRVKVIVNVVDKGQFTGVGRNFRLAKNAAARRALRQIKSSSAA